MRRCVMKDKVTVRTLRPYEKIKLRRLKNQRRNAVNSRHARIVLLSTGGIANRRIAILVDCSIQWVRQVIHHFNDLGIAGITWYPWFQVRSERVWKRHKDHAKPGILDLKGHRLQDLPDLRVLPVQPPELGQRSRRSL